MSINTIIAKNLNRLRNERNLSLGQLAELSGVSKVMLSQIEKGDSNPTVNTIWKIASGLNVPYTAILDQPQNETFIVSKADIDVQVSENEDYHLYCYYPNTPTRNFELFQMELEKGHSYTSVGHSEKSQEYIMILEGQLKLEANDCVYQLKENDSICFSAESVHTYHNQGEKTLKTVIINYYPV